MFSGIVEGKGVVRSVVGGAGLRRLVVDLGTIGRRWTDASVGASVAVNGVCLTVASVEPPCVSFDVVAETLHCSTLGMLSAGDPVNLERSLRAGAPIDGHFVQGHVDGVGRIAAVDVNGGDYRLTVTAPDALMPYIVPKGSIALDGVSLTVAAVGADRFSAALIPTTLSRTTLGRCGVGDAINLETDVLVRAVARLLETRDPPAGVTLNTLRQAGFL